jgi:hypothetical protein
VVVAATKWALTDEGWLPRAQTRGTIALLCRFARGRGVNTFRLIVLAVLLAPSPIRAQDDDGGDRASTKQAEPGFVCVYYVGGSDFVETAFVIGLVGTPFVLLFFGWIWFSSGPAKYRNVSKTVEQGLGQWPAP